MNNYRKYFIRSIKDYYPGEFDQVIANTDNHYATISVDTKFASTSGNPIDKRLDFSAYFLALIKTLDEKGESYDTIRKICLEIVTAYVQPKNRVHAFVKRQVPKLISTWPGQILIRAFQKKTMVNTSTEGFIAHIITDRQETFGIGYGVDILECGICKLFTKHNYFRYATILCEVDQITSELAGLKLIRTGTIANGAARCDFRFKVES
ncbi:L-2-amino-thiazoline-4-carboxylic acid hydrolase [Telluribacter sp. SYSU D00476]|uniref:L-2-amino-thiazoline-4-carboxylic acid hydrolase n=1 Tax=Telluribacter sp. SYSU D00476 TaxID=2811430 RepID=UPI001FF66093|nr:L-2-amino-thiazoline-4-carboxylic acid hydrolase [Telluribacter sp. SYSU D00476]